MLCWGKQLCEVITDLVIPKQRWRRPVQTESNSPGAQTQQTQRTQRVSEYFDVWRWRTSSKEWFTSALFSSKRLTTLICPWRGELAKASFIFLVGRWSSVQHVQTKQLSCETLWNFLVVRAFAWTRSSMIGHANHKVYIFYHVPHGPCIFVDFRSFSSCFDSQSLFPKVSSEIFGPLHFFHTRHISSLLVRTSAKIN